MKTLLFIFFTLYLIPNDSEQFTLAAYYQDNMVLQRAPYQAIIWGYADLNANISLIFKNKEYFSIAQNVEGYDKPIWRLQLDSVSETNPFNLEFKEKDTKIVLKNVLFGDVWLCGGQSNMQLSLNATIEGKDEIQTGSIYKDKIRLFTVETFSSTKPEFDLLKIKQNWSEPSPQSLGNYEWQYFSAVCWHFGKKLAQNLQHPIGLLVSCWGGTEIERWMSPDTLKKCDVTNQNSNHSQLWYSMIHPLLTFPIYGAVWYQGESNTGYNRDKYGCNFENMVESWRENWYEKTNGSTHRYFPFGFVQLANSEKQGDFVDNWVWLRWQQTAGYGYCPNQKLYNIFMSTAIDLVDNGNDPIHPKQKEDVGVRLGLGALSLGYNLKVEYAPPRAKSIYVNGTKVVVMFESDFGEFEFDRIKYENFSKGFDICCDSNSCFNDEYEKWFVLDKFKVDGKKVLLDKPSECKVIKYVRYLWRHKPCEFKNCPLYVSRSNLPVYPFISEVTNENSAHKIENKNLSFLTFIFVIFNFKILNILF